MIYHIISYLERSAEKYSRQIALADEKNRLTYGEVLERVSAAGSRISQRIGGTNRPIAVLIRHDVTDVLHFLSIAYSGNFYVPIDPELPPERIRSILETVQPAALILRENARLPEGLSVQTWPEEELASCPPANTAPWKNSKDTDLLYVIFTSGSTGAPKGVAITHRSVIDMAEQFASVFRFPENTVFGNQAPFDFDVSVKDIYLSLKVGGTLEILEKKLFSFPKLLIERLNERRVTTVIWAVPALKIIATLRAFKKDRPRFLENVLFSGEVLPPKTLAYWQEALPDVRFVNLYGPTEITCNCTYHIIHGSIPENEAIPIGRAFPNCSVFLLNGDQPVTEEGTPGEICVTGSCLAAGYYDRPDLTEAAFPPNPLQSAYREPLYRTGDIGCIRQGLLYYMGRQDAQIKHMGHRIELAEIELCANSAAGVETAACIYWQEAARIVLFYQGDAEPKTVAAHLRERLPRYMLPALWIPLKDFPRTRTGKIDRKMLLNLAKGE